MESDGISWFARGTRPPRGRSRVAGDLNNPRNHVESN
jgi:hypothetical protein